jgi:hypothetical protein
MRTSRLVIKVIFYNPGRAVNGCRVPALLRGPLVDYPGDDDPQFLLQSRDRRMVLMVEINNWIYSL